jgi:hypothetical protein
MSLYVNGTPAGSATTNVNIATIQNSPLDPKWYVGRHGTPNDQRTFRGDIDSIAVWNEALTANNVTELYAVQNDWDVTVSNLATNLSEAVAQSQGEIHFEWEADALYSPGFIRVDFGFSGTATFGTDYTVSGLPAGTSGYSGYFVLPPNASTFDLTINVLNDNIIETHETIEFTATLSNLCTNEFIGTECFNIVIQDDEKLGLNSVQFTNNLALISDTEGSFGVNWKNATHWTNGQPNSTLPVAYSGGTADNKLSTNAAVTIGQVSADVTQLQVRLVYGNWTSDWVTVTATGNYSVNFSQTFAELFGRQQAYYDAAMNLSWEFKVNDENHGEFASTVNTLYVTYKNPVVGTVLYHTVVHTGCIAANGVDGTNEADVFDAVWDKFTSLEIKKVNLVNGQVVDGETLSYYGKDVDGANAATVAANVKATLVAPDTPSRARQYEVDTTQGLLQTTDATCGGWEVFCKSVYAAQGIAVTGLGIVVDNSQTVTVTVFKVKPTAAGQGTTAPRESIWYNHGVIEYNGKIYDPSYGLEYGLKANALTTFVTTSLESFGTETAAVVGGGVNAAGYAWQYVADTTVSLNAASAAKYLKWEA